MSTRKERRERSKTWRGGVCMNCGEKGRHFAPPGFGSPGMYICKPKTETGTPVVITSTCPLCDTDVEITGYLSGDVDAGFSFTSDEDGTKTAWDHQALHDAEEVGLIATDRPAP